MTHYIGSVKEIRGGGFTWEIMINRKSPKGRMVTIAWLESARGYKTEEAAVENRLEVMKVLKIPAGKLKDQGLVRR